MDNIKVFIGIDPTGAVDSKGKAKPLQVSVIDARKIKTKTFTSLKIAALDFKAITQLLESTIGEFESEKVLICVGSVLGLPAELKVSPRRLRSDIGSFSFAGKTHGALTAHNFFRSYLVSNEIPHRKVELKVKAIICKKTSC